MLDLRNRKNLKTVSTIIVILLAVAMVIPTILIALQGAF